MLILMIDNRLCSKVSWVIQAKRSPNSVFSVKLQNNNKVRTGFKGILHHLVYFPVTDRIDGNLIQIYAKKCNRAHDSLPYFINVINHKDVFMTQLTRLSNKVKYGKKVCTLHNPI